jgi:hypothetical protein
MQRNPSSAREIHHFWQPFGNLGGVLWSVRNELGRPEMVPYNASRCHGNEYARHRERSARGLPPLAFENKARGTGLVRSGRAHRVTLSKSLRGSSALAFFVNPFETTFKTASSSLFRCSADTTSKSICARISSAGYSTLKSPSFGVKSKPIDIPRWLSTPTATPNRRPA